MSMYQALEVASSEAPAPAAASALYIYYVVIRGREVHGEIYKKEAAAGAAVSELATYRA